MKTACVYHKIDLDGWMSAAIVKKYNESIDVDRKNFPRDIDFIGYNYKQPIPDLSEYDKVIMCDISFPKEIMIDLYTKLSGNFIWIDHHISAIKDCCQNTYIGDLYQGKRDTKFAACELTWMYFFPEQKMPEIVRLLGRYDCFGHKGTEEEITVLQFQYGARAIIIDVESAYTNLEIVINEAKNEKFDMLNLIYAQGIGIYSFLCTDAKQSYKNGFPVMFIEPAIGIGEGHKAGLGSMERKFIVINKERFNPINFGIDYHKDGYDGCACFHRTNDGKWAFSLYNDNGLVDCSVIAKQFGGGGHKGASGFITNDLKNIFN